jgi:hypothetical protein
LQLSLVLQDGRNLFLAQPISLDYGQGIFSWAFAGSSRIASQIATHWTSGRLWDTTLKMVTITIPLYQLVGRLNTVLLRGRGLQ